MKKMKKKTMKMKKTMKVKMNNKKKKINVVGDVRFPLYLFCLRILVHSSDACIDLKQPSTRLSPEQYNVSFSAISLG